MDNALRQKFKIKPSTTVEVVNATKDYAFSQTGNRENMAIVFVNEQDDVTNFAVKFVKQVLEETLILWCAYPKKSSGVKTDISRDHGWDYLTSKGLEIVSVLSIDEIWSAARFKKKAANSTKSTDQKERVVIVPASLQQLLDKNATLKKFFEALSPTNKKEYSVWISSAKRTETLEKRLAATEAKLKAGKKNPSEK